MTKRRTLAQARSEGWEAGRNLAIAEVTAKLRALGHADAAKDLMADLSKPRPVIRYSGYDYTAD